MTEVEFIPKQFVVVSETEPSPFEGLIWYNPQTKLWKQYSGGQWQIIIPFVVSDTQPAETQDGLIWYDKASKKLKAYNSSTAQFEEIVKKPDLYPVITQITDLYFRQSVSDILLYEQYDYAEIISPNEANGVYEYLLLDFETDLTNGGEWTKSTFINSFAVSTAWASKGSQSARAVSTSAGQYAYLYKDIDFDAYTPLSTSELLADKYGSGDWRVYIAGTLQTDSAVAQDANNAYTYSVDISSQTGLQTLKVGLYFGGSASGYFDFVRIISYNNPHISMELTQNTVTEFIILSLNGNQVYDRVNSPLHNKILEITDGTNTITNPPINTPVVQTLQGLKVNWYYPRIGLDTIAIIWRESV